MKFKNEDEAYDAYMEYCQENFPYDITESNIDFSDGFFDWMDAYNVEIEDD